MTEQLKALAQRIERLMDERDGIQSDIRDIYTEAKSHGYVPKVLRKAITRKRMDAGKRDEEDAILELYEGALDAKTRKAVKMAREGATARQIEAETGMDHATVARSVALNKKSATGEHAPESISVLSGRGERSDEISKSCGGEPSNLTSETLEATVSEGPARHHATGDAGTAGSASLGTSLTDVASRCEPGPQDTTTSSEQEAPAALEGQIACELDGGKPCPNTCARQGFCVWAGEVKGETGSATVVATGNLDALSPVAVGTSPDACSTGDDAGPIPSFLRRNGVATAKTPSHPDERERAAT